MGGAIVEDCLRAVRALLANNASNQLLLGDSDENCVPLIAPFLKAPSHNSSDSQRTLLLHVRVAMCRLGRLWPTAIDRRFLCRPSTLWTS